MPDILRLKAGPVVFEVPYYSELLMNNENGRLQKDLACHALWTYYGQALTQLRKAKQNIVYEDELSQVFNIDVATRMISAISNMYGTPILDMIKYWDAVERQRIALGGGETLPNEYKFQFSGRN